MSISAPNPEVLVTRSAGTNADCFQIPLLQQANNSLAHVEKRHTAGLIDPLELVLDSRAILVEKGEWSTAVCDIQ
jgi:hypothetical protein